MTDSDDDDRITTLDVGGDPPLGTPEERGDFLPEDDPAEAEPLAADTEDGSAQAQTSTIPKARFDQERVRRMMAEAELQRLQEQLTQPQPAAAPVEPEKTPQEWELMVWEARMSGDEALAEQYRTQMWDAIDRKTLRLASQAITQRDLANDLKVAADEVSAAYPVLATDAQAQSDVVTYRDFLYFQKGIPLAEALRVAAKTVCGEPGSQAAPPPAPPDPSSTRQRAAVQRAADTSLRQPPPVTAAGMGARAQPARVNVAAMSEAEFEKLPDEELRRARGDFLT